jgi:methyl-accepting chemotaxis protein
MHFTGARTSASGGPEITIGLPFAAYLQSQDRIESARLGRSARGMNFLGGWMSKDHDLDQRLRFLKIDERSRATLRSLKPFLDEELPGALDALSDQQRNQPETRAAYRDPAVAEKTRATQRRHWDNLAHGDLDDRHMASIGAVARAHAMSGLEPHWHIAGAAVVAEQLVRAMVRRAWPKPGLFADKKAPSADQVAESLATLVKVIMLDADLVISILAEDGADEGSEAGQAAIDEQHALVAGTVAAGLERLADGDLQYRLSQALPPQYEKLRGDFNAAMAHLQDTVSVIGRNTQAIRAGAGEIASAADDLSQRTEQQAASLEQTAAALDQITATVRKTADGADHARDVVGKAKADAERGGVVVREAVQAMGEIEASSHKVSQIIGVIDEIAFQTNLLALNAGVEAARAGDAGRGFAVVAQEVRALAQRSAEAAKEIKALISASTAQVGSGVKLVGETGQSLERIVAQVADINAVVAEIAASAKEQATGLAEVNGAVNQMDNTTQQNAAMVEQSTAASHALAQEADELARLLSRFRTGQREIAVAPPRARSPAPRPAPGVGRLTAPTRPALPASTPADSKGSAFASRFAAPQLRSPGGRGVSAAIQPSEDWEEF